MFIFSLKTFMNLKNRLTSFCHFWVVNQKERLCIKIPFDSWKFWGYDSKFLECQKLNVIRSSIWFFCLQYLSIKVTTFLWGPTIKLSYWWVFCRFWLSFAKILPNILIHHSLSKYIFIASLKDGDHYSNDFLKIWK